MASSRGSKAFGQIVLAVAGIAGAGSLSAEELSAGVLAAMDACLVESAVSRDVANSTIVCFNEAHRSCADDLAACETAMSSALSARADGLLARLPVELDGVPDFAKERYREILTDIENGALGQCDDLPAEEAVSCTYHVQALRFAKLRSVGAQVDPSLLMP
ncbi:hypothetical protein [Tropicimonas marinistellae]|uniref:hypothetical protein n=1 Tax=Tropicimonas marinistellae TaxID=1739787 RepID=UPI0008322A27|nr:hypothetical protein [Tropicimonas marinistellae]